MQKKEIPALKEEIDIQRNSIQVLSVELNKLQQEKKSLIKILKKTCPYCDIDQRFDNVKINYCPICGELLGEE